MNSYEEIKKLLEKKDFQSALLVAFSNSLRFKLTSKINSLQESSSIETEINLLNGITTKASDSQILNSNNELINFHKQQLEKVHDIWDTNREILTTIFQVLANNEVINVNTLSKTSSTLNRNSVIPSEQSIQTDNNEVDNIVGFMLEENSDNNNNNWQNEDEDDSINKEENIVISAQRKQELEESWGEFMEDLSAEEEAVTEEVIVNDEAINWNQEDWQEETVISNK